MEPYLCGLFQKSDRRRALLIYHEVGDGRKRAKARKKDLTTHQQRVLLLLYSLGSITSDIEMQISSHPTFRVSLMRIQNRRATVIHDTADKTIHTVITLVAQLLDTTSIGTRTSRSILEYVVC